VVEVVAAGSPETLALTTAAHVDQNQVLHRLPSAELFWAPEFEDLGSKEEMHSPQSFQLALIAETNLFWT
jgi:hypothetical protein